MALDTGSTGTIRISDLKRILEEQLFAHIFATMLRKCRKLTDRKEVVQEVVKVI